MDKLMNRQMIQTLPWRIYQAGDIEISDVLQNSSVLDITDMESIHEPHHAKRALSVIFIKMFIFDCISL